MPPIPVSQVVAQDGLDPAARARLTKPPFDELHFVPADVNLVARVDLAKMVTTEPEAAEKLDFLLQAQQPAAWSLLGAAGVTLGREIGALYLVVRREEVLVAALGSIDEARLNEALAKRSSRPAVPVANGTVFEWPKAGLKAVGGHDPGDERMGPVAIGVTNGILLVGAPSLVRRALEVQAGHGRDVRGSPLAREIAPAPASAIAWAALRGDRDPSLATIAPGLLSARLHATPPAVEVQAAFKGATEAKAFQDKLGLLLGLGARMAGETTIGETLQRLQKEARITVEGATLRVSASL